MTRPRWITWLIFLVCALAVVEGLGWVTWQSLRLERREREARQQAQVQELVRLALWRMESEITPVLAQEAARPYFHYQAFYPAERAYTRMWQEVQPGEVLVPSPLLESGGAYTRLYFQMHPDGVVSSPQAPTGAMRELALQRYVDPEFLLLESRRLDELRRIVSARRELARAMGYSDLEDSEVPAAAAEPAPAPARPAATPAPAGAVSLGKDREAQEQFTANEYAARQQAAQTANMPAEQNRNRKGSPQQKVEREGTEAPATAMRSQGRAEVDARASDVDAARLRDFDAILRADRPPLDEAAGPEGREVAPTPFAASWAADPAGGLELLLERRVRLPGGEVVQGIWIDWPALRSRLLAVVRDLLPGATLAAVTTPEGTSPGVPHGLMLASIPVILRPGTVDLGEAFAPAPAHATLILTWLAVLGGIVAIGVVLRKSMELSDRRGRFVSAVTHELRTPLTTFCLYTEMLEAGMVPQEASRGYLRTLHEQARRLAGIVENVLEFARLGGKRPASQAAPIRGEDLIARVRPALEACADRCGMSLMVGAPGPGAALADPATVERILINLVDNACKYASGAADRRIHLDAGPGSRPGQYNLRIRDHGPGIPRGEERRVFQPFQRGSGAADGSKAGLGLGLALARGLARQMGGDLLLDRPEDGGAEFRLVLPASP